MINLNAWFQKHGLCAENILYIYRKDRKTVIQRTDGAEFALFVPVHSVLSTLPEKNFLSISKGIVVCRSHIVNISNDGVYTMSDGRTFQGRKRDMSSHRRLRAEIELTNTKHRPLSMLEKCSLLDNMPLAFCVIELVFNEDGCGVDFIFRYCNAEMATVEGVPVEEMLNRSFYRVFPNGDKKWLPCGFLCYLFAPSVLNCQHFLESFITHDHPFFIGEFLFSAKSGLHSLHLQESQQALSHTLLLPVVSVHKHSLPVPRAYK